MNAESPTEAATAVNRRITALAVGTAVFLIAIKAFALGASGSVSILASLTDSALDLAASLVTFFAVRWAAVPPDAEHRHGHGKAEALSALFQAGLIFASAVFIGWEAVQRMIDPRPVTAGSWAVGVMVVSIIVTLGLVWMQTRAVRATGSPAVSGDRAHYAADLGANLVVLIGVASGAWLGAAGLDAAAGLIVAVWLVWGAAGVLRGSANQLLERAADDDVHARVVAAALADPRVRGVHQLRTRMAGSVLMVQMHMDLAPDQTLAQAHAVMAGAEGRIMDAFPGADVLIHPDPRAAAPPPDDGASTAVPVTE